MIVAIDGHAGSGKSSLGRRLARFYRMHYIDTGAMYRGVALGFLRGDYSFSAVDGSELSLRLERMNLEFLPTGADFRVFLDGEDVTQVVRQQEVGKLASQVAALEPVRRFLTQMQRSFAAMGDLVVEGRDIGTVVFPAADLKIFLTASSSVRAGRRYTDAAGGSGRTQAETQREIEERDKNDSTREIAPLAQSPDAVFIDTSNLSLDEVFSVVESCLAKLER